jgi:large subunit ribosomal protein L6e
MSELLFIAPVQKKDPRRPTWRGIPRIAFSRPAVAADIDPIKKLTEPTPERTTRASLSIGTIVIILDGPSKGKRAVVVKDVGAGIVGVAGPVVAYEEVDQDYLIATSTKINLPSADPADVPAAIAAAAKKQPELTEYLSATFSLKPGDRPHLMCF